jgi:hypothetical protein
MASLAHFFIANDEEAVRYGAETSLPEGELVEATTFNTLHLSILWDLLRGREWDAETIDEFAELGDGGEEGPWLHRFPTAFTERLASASDLDTEVRHWAGTEDVDADPDDMVELVQQLRGLARNARASGRHLYLWTSL